ncbi:MAG: HU family DNA-binding protein [Balneolaceae bacterium]|jgi:DNA-binding protein HU-beta
MSEKITFKELIESIAEETNNSKKFTHDFLKNLAGVINQGLEKDGNVNIAGFGKFDLKRVDEREGFNPQTKEKMTIPTHNKIIFKPYKDLRELVNAPYAHLEPKLIESEAEKSREQADSQPSKSAKEDNFIPTAPPTSHESPDAEDKQDETEEHKKSEPDPFELHESDSIPSSSFTFEADTGVTEDIDEDEKDIVEYSREALNDSEEMDYVDELDEIFNSTEESHTAPSESVQADEKASEEPTPIENTKEKETPEEDDDLPFNPKQEENGKKGRRVNDVAPSSKNNTRYSRPEDKASSLPIIIAAALALLLVAGGAWYFGWFSGTPHRQKPVNQTITKADVTKPTKNHSKAEKKDTQDRKATHQNRSNRAKNQSANPGTKITPKKEDQITITKGQTLWSIARKKYNNPRLWPWIYDHNESIDNPDLIFAGNNLSIPLPTGSHYGLSSSDSVEVAKGYITTYKWYKDNGSPKAKNYLWVAKRYHKNIRDIANVKIDKEDLAFANRAK